MAEFSKQYQEAFNHDWNDFDYTEIFKDLNPNEAVSQICCKGRRRKNASRGGSGRESRVYQVDYS